MSWPKNARINKKHTPETKRKMSIAALGRKGHNKGGYKLSKEFKRKAQARKGERAGGWKGGLMQIPGYKSWIHNKRWRTLRANGGSHTFDEWQNLKAQCNWTCPICKEKEPKIKLVQDHIIPVSRGGSDNIENIQPLCRKCNGIKHARL